MKFLLAAVNAKYIHSNLAVYSLRAYAGPVYADQIEVAEYTINQQEEQILADIFSRKPQVIGFSCYIWNWQLIRELLQDLPAVLPGVQIWLGGPEVSYDNRGLLQEFPAVTGIMIGEGEETFRELMGWYTAQAADAGALSSVPDRIRGTVTRSGDYGVREPVDLDCIPFFYADLPAKEQEHFQHKILYYETSRGCPYRCAYCLSSIDKTVRFRSFELVQRELQFFLDHRVPQVKLIDRTFNCNHVHAQQIWRYLLEHDNGVTNFHFEISADLMTQEELDLLGRLRPGLVQLEIGVQTANPQALAAVGRTASLNRIAETVAAVHSFHNIHQHLDLIAGLPYEDLTSFAHSFDVVYAMKPQQLQLGFLKVLKGARMEEMAQQLGIRYCKRPPYEVLSTEWLPYQDLLVLKRVEEMVELYYNSNQFTATLAVLEQTFSSPFAMFLALADDYAAQGYLISQPSRLYRYEILRQFAERSSALPGDLWAELLTFDYYLRENAKTRPDFCRPLGPWQRKISGFYHQEATNPQFLTSYQENGFDAKQMARMTHTEVFYYPVWKSGGNPADLAKEKRQERFLLFDYQNRDVLTGDAGYQEITDCVMRQAEVAEGES